MKKLVIVLTIFVVGCFAGWHLKPDPFWDIGEDERACVIYWDDGTVSYKSRTINLGTLKPGESVKISPSDLMGKEDSV
jgi:hypothetical protein